MRKKQNLLKRMANDPHYSGLSVRATNILHYRELRSKSEITEAIKHGSIAWTKDGGKLLRNYGWKTYLEILVWCGLKAPKIKKAQRYCPHCGKEIDVVPFRQVLEASA